MQETRSTGFLFLAAVTIAAAPPQPISYVASVKLNNDANPRSMSEYSPGGRFTANAVMIGSLIRAAYRIQGYQLVGAPDWIGAKRFDISAKSDDNPAPSQQSLLQALLKDRFQLVVHNETREMPVFDLVVAKGGPKFQKSDVQGTTIYEGPDHIDAIGSDHTLAILCESLGKRTGRVVVDKTGLDGRYKLTLKWTPDDMAAAGRTGPDAPPDLFTAIQE